MVFARAAGAAEHVGVAYFVLLDGVFERALDMGLAHHSSNVCGRYLRYKASDIA